MFDHFLWSVVVVPPLVVLAVRWLADRLAPATAARAVAWSALAVAAASTFNLVLFALHAVAEIPLVGGALGWSTRVVYEDTERVPFVPWLSVALLAYAVVALIWRLRRHRRVLALIPPGEHSGGLVMVDDDEARAFAVPGRPGRVVVTTGMRAALTDRQFEALLAHENAHLTERHHRLARAADLAVAAHPALWWVGRHVDYLIERAADERAAAELGSRNVVARAIGAAALAGTAPRATPHLHAASAGGVIPRRVARLLQPSTAQAPRILYAVPVALAAASIIWTGEATIDLIELFISAGRAA
ncbi:peptidase M48 [Paractinoplanes deccanensis]|uniref:Peptidase M48 n=1 Tax=Paractinoplanes deccanensis TaxID=113561 RepID=A0ABQ3Y3C4_9ACTN|nr:M48 family metalloprotease [Actinoplanes deccanensis]GID74499.1 peptidase M48 [Actinoplanes deccanensis]